MAIKKYISPDSFKETLRDNFRKFMGQYWLKDANGILKYGENIKTLEIPAVGTPWDASQQATLTITPDNPFEQERDLIISRSEEFVPPVGEIEYGLWHSSYHTNYYKYISCELYLKVAGNIDNYPTLQSFTDDVRMVF